MIFDLRFMIYDFSLISNRKSAIVNRKLFWLCLFTILTLSSPSNADDSAASFQVDNPAGWVMDNRVGVGQGANTVFYPKGGSWRGSSAVMYIRTMDKVLNSLQRTIDADLDNYQEISPQIKLTDEPPLFTKHGDIARVKKLKDPESGNLEIIAYIPEEQIVSIITLNARNEKDAAKAMPAFKSLVESYSSFDYDEDLGE